MNDLSIGEMVKQTGIPEGTLRMWERRHGFPRPRRSESGHRRYSEQEIAVTVFDGGHFYLNENAVGIAEVLASERETVL